MTRVNRPLAGFLFLFLSGLVFDGLISKADAQTGPTFAGTSVRYLYFRDNAAIMTFTFPTTASGIRVGTLTYELVGAPLGDANETISVRTGLGLTFTPGYSGTGATRRPHPLRPLWHAKSTGSLCLLLEGHGCS